MLNFAYIIGDQETGEGMVIDPLWEPEKVYDIAREEGININTHCHEDHVNGNRTIKEFSVARIAIHEAETKYLTSLQRPI